MAKDMDLDGDRPYLAACMVYRNHADYLVEWVAFHKLVGVERFFLYDNGSSDHHLDVLDPYLEEGTVVLHEWPEILSQEAVYNDCLGHHREDARWIAFIDVDEFLFSPLNVPVSQVLADYEDAPGVGVNWVNFGTSGHRETPPGLVTENFLYANRNPKARRVIKSVVDPSRTLRCENPHYFRYRSGFAVDEQMRPITGPQLALSEQASCSRLRINHYFTKSEEEFRRKWSDWERVLPRKPIDPPRGDDRDETIQTYVPRLRAAVAGAQGRQRQ
jgi:hypothetical protein